MGALIVITLVLQLTAVGFVIYAAVALCKFVFGRLAIVDRYQNRRRGRF